MFKKNSYSQGGEDLILVKLLGNKPKGFFIDVGANDPELLNNTYLFYRKGWSGVNFEPIPELAEKFRRKRDRDIVITKAMSNFKGEAVFSTGIKEYEVNSSLLSVNLPKQKNITVEVDTLENILDQLGIQEIDFISIDTEGTEVDVLEGLNLSKYRPKFILAEYNTSSKANNQLSPYLFTHGYQPVYINKWNIIFSENFSTDAINCYQQSNKKVKNIFRSLIRKITAM